MKRGLIILGLCAFTPVLKAELFPKAKFFESAGVRAGISDNGGGQVSEFEFFATSSSIADWSLTNTTSVSLHWEGAAGVFSYEDDRTFSARFGPMLDLSFDDSPFHFVFSTSVAYLADHEFGRRDLGSELQFVSSLGFDWEFSPNWVLGYRRQHISNAGFDDTNPGLNLNTISVGFRF